MANNFNNLGVMKEMGNERYIIINQKDLTKTIELLDTHISSIYKPIKYNVHEIIVGKAKAVALSSADPNFYMGIGENSVLSKAGIKNMAASSEGGFVQAKSLSTIRKNAAFLGLPELTIFQKFSATTVDLCSVHAPKFLKRIIHPIPSLGL